MSENIATNKKAFFDYYIEEKFEAGLVLKGSEVKALRAARVNLKDGFIKIVRGEAFVFGVHIGVLDTTHHYYTHEERGSRKLLLHKSEIRKLIGQTKEKGFSLVPTKIYFKNSKVKVEIALARGKKDYDKRQSIAKKDAQRSMDRKMKEFNQR